MNTKEVVIRLEFDTDKAYDNKNASLRECVYEYLTQLIEDDSLDYEVNDE